MKNVTAAAESTGTKASTAHTATGEAISSRILALRVGIAEIAVPPMFARAFAASHWSSGSSAHFITSISLCTSWTGSIAARVDGAMMVL